MEFNKNIDAIEYICNQKIIPFLAELAKVMVTLICLSIKGTVSLIKYINTITGGEEVAAVKQWAMNIKSNEIDIKPPFLIPKTLNGV